MTNGLRVTSLSASLLQKIYMYVATDSLCQMALNRKLWRKFDMCCTFSSRVTAKSRKMKSPKMKPVGTLIWFRVQHYFVHIIRFSAFIG